MILNYGPKGITSSSIDFGRTFNFSKDISFSYGNKTKVSFATAEEDNICSLIQNDKNWDLKILQDCIIIFNKKITANLFLVSGGGKGQDGSQSGGTYGTESNQRYYTWAGGQGGYGGNVLLKKDQLILKNYQIQCTIGQGATKTTSDITTTTMIKIFNENSNNESYSVSEQLIDNNLDRDYGIGGSGRSYHNENVIKNETNSNIQNNNSDGYLFHGNKYGAGGGGGGASYNATAISTGGDGGINGGGKGGGHISNNGAYNGDPGIPNTGSGGGGGAACNYAGSQYTGTGGDGGSGIIIISNYL